jgi:hypothetical protein
VPPKSVWVSPPYGFKEVRNFCVSHAVGIVAKFQPFLAPRRSNQPRLQLRSERSSFLLQVHLQMTQNRYSLRTRSIRNPRRSSGLSGKPTIHGYWLRTSQGNGNGFLTQTASRDLIDRPFQWSTADCQIPEVLVTIYDQIVASVTWKLNSKHLYPAWYRSLTDRILQLGQ